MNLYLIRHADAAAPAEGASDADRRLTDTGRSQCQQLAAALQRRGVALDLICTSPLARARETAENLLRHWTTPPELKVSELLAPAFRRKKLARQLRALGKDNVALVGHEPDLSHLAAWLIGSRKAKLDFAKAGAAAIVCDSQPGKGEGRLLWLVTPEWLT